MNAELIRFVREALAKRVPREQIRTRLLEARWPEDEVGSALAAFADVDFPIPVPRPRAYRSARDAFLYLALFSTLYTSAISLGSLHAPPAKLTPKGRGSTSNPSGMGGFGFDSRNAKGTMTVGYPGRAEIPAPDEPGNSSASN